MATRTLEQVRAKKAYEQVARIENEPESRKKAYGRVAHKLPVLIRQAGLAQALTFIEAKAKDGSERILDHLAEYLKEVRLLGSADRKALMERSRQAELREYMHLTQEIQGALLWHKRYAQSVLNVQQGEEEDNR
jgi:CRISPR-associated protein Cmr5